MDKNTWTFSSNLCSLTSFIYFSSVQKKNSSNQPGNKNQVYALEFNSQQRNSEKRRSLYFWKNNRLNLVTRMSYLYVSQLKQENRMHSTLLHSFVIFRVRETGFFSFFSKIISIFSYLREESLQR